LSIGCGRDYDTRSGIANRFSIDFMRNYDKERRNSATVGGFAGDPGIRKAGEKIERAVTLVML
jgi:hypothetical protein